MRTSIILLALICISNWSYGQDYDLNTYQYRYQKYQGLLANFSLASQGGNSSIDIQDSSKTSTYDSKSNGNSINTSINPGYFSFTNLDNIQKTLSVDFSDNFIFGMSNSIQTGNTLNSSFNNNIAQLSVIATNRYYYGSKFDLVNISTQLNRISMTNEQTSTRYFRETNNKSTSIDWEVKVGRGKGRMQ